MTPTQALTTEEWMRNRWGAYRGHFAWREIEEAFNAGAALSAAPVEPVAWTLRSELDARETTCKAHLWFTNPQNSAWAPLYAAPAPAEPAPEGWRLVPVEPTPEMLDAANRARLYREHGSLDDQDVAQRRAYNSQQAWAAMLAAAPASPKG